MTPQERYDERLAIVADQLAILEYLLENHQYRQSQDTDNWGFVGDLSMVTDHLLEITSFMNSGSGRPNDDFFTPDMAPDTVEAESEYFGLMADNEYITRG